MDEGGDGGGRTNAGRKAYQAMMQEKRIVGALQAEQNAKAAQTQAASQRAKDDYRAGEKAYDIAQASTPNNVSGKPLAMPVPVENRVTDKEREEAMTAYREGERNAVSIAEEYKSQVREEANQSYREGERDAVAIAEDYKARVREKVQQIYLTGEREYAIQQAEEEKQIVYLQKITRTGGLYGPPTIESEITPEEVEDGPGKKYTP
ncbi:MAG: hypothetical protein IPJ47_16380 [Anaerolineales bacterium]|nr:hypothetical protein [Anaerolineales bacterium]